MMERYHEIVDYNRCLYDCGAKYKMAALEAQLAEAQADAQLARDLREIEAAGYSVDLLHEPGRGHVAELCFNTGGAAYPYEDLYQYYDTRAEAVAAALAWVKEG